MTFAALVLIPPTYVRISQEHGVLKLLSDTYMQPIALPEGKPIT